MGKRLRLTAIGLALGALVLAATADITAAQGVAGAEKLGLTGRRGPKLLRPGFAVGEFTGSASSMGSTRMGFGSKDKMKADFDVGSPDMATPVTGECAGGQSELVIAWITWAKEDLAYVCRFGGSAPADASLTLALSRGSLLGRIQQPQRAGEIRWNGRSIRFETKRLGGLPFGGGKVMGYVFTKDGAEIGGLDINGIQPTFYLPPKGSPDRTPVMVAAMSLFAFQDPGYR